MEYILKIKPYHPMNRASAIADHNSYSCFNDLHRFDPATMTWALLSPRGSPPSPRYGFGFAAAGDGALYAFGGAGYFVGEARNRAKFGRAQSRKIRRAPLDDRMPPSCRRSGPQASGRGCREGGPGRPHRRVVAEEAARAAGRAPYALPAAAGSERRAAYGPAAGSQVPGRPDTLSLQTGRPAGRRVRTRNRPSSARRRRRAQRGWARSSSTICTGTICPNALLLFFP